MRDERDDLQKTSQLMMRKRGDDKVLPSSDSRHIEKIARFRCCMSRRRQVLNALFWNTEVSQNVSIYLKAAVSLVLPLALIDR